VTSVAGIALGSILGLLFVEELGIPLPMFPADGLLLAAGVLAATGTVRIWLLVPMLVVTDIAGAASGYTWVRLLRRRRLTSVAGWLGRSSLLRGIADRLRSAGTLGVFVARLIPGTRVYTTLVAGAIDVRPRTYFLGMVPASAVWVAVVTLLGMVLGTRARPYIARFEAFSGDALAVLGALCACYLALRYVPDLVRRSRRPQATSSLSRLVLGLTIDAAIVGAVAAAAAALALGVIQLQEPDGLPDFCLLVGATCVAYVGATRSGMGSTIGEQLFAVTFVRSRLIG
jgi:membrane-associated protein